MQGVLLAACGTLFTFAMTALGAALVFLFRQPAVERCQRPCMGFAAGVMSAAAVFSLLVPAAEQSRAAGGMPALTVTVGFALGAGAMLGAEALLSGRHQALGESQRRQHLMLTAVTLHNIPEGMAVGLAFAMASEAGTAALTAASALALGIGIQNLPEGAAVSLPLMNSGSSRTRSFLLGAASGAVEPLFGILVVLAASAAQAALPLLMAFAAGAMMLVVMEDMIPDAAKDRRGIPLAMLGYVIMMALDVALG